MDTGYNMTFELYVRNVWYDDARVDKTSSPAKYAPLLVHLILNNSWTWIRSDYIDQ